MKIASIFVRNFRSLRCVDVPHCSAVNAIIGKNNAGKSNVLAAIDMAAGQFRLGNVTSEWPTRGRPLDKYFGRDTANRIQIGMQFDASAEFIARAKELIASGVEGIDVPLSSINEKSSFYIIVSGHFRAGKIARYVEALGFGTLHSDAERLTASGVKIFQLPDQIADEVIDNERLISELQENSESIDRAVVEISPNLREDREYRKYMIARIVESRPLNRDLNVALQNAAQDASDSADFEKRVLPHKASIQSRVAEVRAKLTSEPMQAFSGFVRKVPDYVPEIITELGKINILHFEVAKPAIGSEEASQLLKLKTTRGGPVQLSAFQNVVQSLLGVSVDAFSPEGEGLVRRGRNAEMDIDDFLVDANGSGIREALRIVLDIELKKPDIVLIEEPEVHLHPGLEKAVHSYLNEKGQTQQIFIATHSTNFLDVSSRQNVYVASRHGLETRIEKVASEDDILRIPADIGLRPSTLFMFDRLAFVEGPTDEDMIRAFSKTLGVESALKNVGFVKLGGASNIVYYSIDATLDLLSKRQIPMTFVLDRDERSDAETQKIEKRLGSRASFVVLSRRELENYLLDPEAIRSVLIAKVSTSGRSSDFEVTESQIASIIHEVALGLKDHTADLAVHREVLKPLYINRFRGSNPQEKLAAALEALQERISSSETDTAKVIDDIAKNWADLAIKRAPGEEILGEVFQRFGCVFRKEQDSVRLAERIRKEKIDTEIVTIVNKIIGA